MGPRNDVLEEVRREIILCLGRHPVFRPVDASLQRPTKVPLEQ